MIFRPANLAFGLIAIMLAACSGDEAPGRTQAAQSSVSAGDPAVAANAEAGDTAGSAAQPVSPPMPEPKPEPKPEPEAEAATEPPPETAGETVVAESAAPVRHVVKGVVTQWAPMVLFVKPGDQIVFLQMAGHDSETIEGMIPEGAKAWKSKMGQEGFAVAPEVPGVYIYKCNPHVSLGMIGAIVVGDTPPGNLDVIEAHPQNKGMIGRAIRKLKQALEQQG